MPLYGLAAVTFRTLEIAEALQSKTLFGQRGPVGGRIGHRLIWKRCFMKWEAGRREKDGEERSVAIITKERDVKVMKMGEKTFLVRA